MNENIKKRRTKTHTEKEISTPSLVKNRRTESVPNLPNNQYIGNNTLYNQYNINSKHIQEIHIDLKNLPKGMYNKYNPEPKYSQNNSLTFRNKNNNNYFQESYNSSRINNTDANTPENLAYIQNITYSPPFVETYEIQFGRDRGNQNRSMDNTYYQSKTYINKNDNYNNNSFYKNNEYYSHNNSFVMNNTNIEEESKLNNSNQDKDYYYKNTYTNIPKPKKFKKKIPPIPIRRSNDYNINNNSFYFDEAANSNINNNIILNKQNNRYYNIKSENDKKNINYNIIHKKSKTEYKGNIYSNKTHSPRYIKDIEKFGIQISFSSKKRNESIDLISPEVFKDLKRHSSDKKNKIIMSDLDMNKVKQNKYNINCNNLFNNKSENYQKMRKKYIQRLSSFLLKNRKNKLAKSHSARKEKYDIIDIKEKIKKERRKRSISNNSKLRKKESVKDNPAATSIRKEDDKGGKIDFIIPTKNIRNKTYSQTIRKGIKAKQCSSNFIINKSRITIKAAKTIQKWWRNILSQFLTELNIIKIQSVFRSYIKRKEMTDIMTEILLIKYKRRENITKIIFIQKKWKEYYISIKKKKYISKNNKNFVYRKVHKPFQNKFGKNIHENNNNKNNNNNYIQQNNSFGIISQKRKDSFDNKNENQNDNENNVYNDLSKNGMFNDIKINEIPSLIQTKNDIIEIKGIDDSHNDEDEDIYKCLKSDYNSERSNRNVTDRTNPLFIERNNLKLCFYTKKCYKNQEKNIIFIQKCFRYYLKCKKEFYLDDKEEKIIKIPILLFTCFVEKIRIRKNKTNVSNNIISNTFSYNFSINNGENINYSPNKNTDNKYDENKIKMRREKQMLIIGNKDGNNLRFINNINNYNNKNKNIDNQILQNLNDINYVHDIEFSINKENREGINQNPFIKKCYYSKKNIILIKKAPIEYSISKINSEKYPSSKKNILLEINPILSLEFAGKQKNKTEFQISQNISDNYITPSLQNIENKDKNENIDNKNNYLFTYSFYKTKTKPNKQNLFEICSINTEIINSQNKSNNEKEIFDINNKNDTLNDNKNQIESILKIPVQLENYFTKNNIIIDNYKNELDNKIINLNSNKNINCYISKVYKVDKTKEMILIQRLFRNRLYKRKMESSNTFMKQIVSNYLITKEIKMKDNLKKSEDDNNRVLNGLNHLNNSNSNLADDNDKDNDKDNEILISNTNILQKIQKEKDTDNNNKNKDKNIDNKNNLYQENMINGERIYDKYNNINNKKNIPYNKDIKINGEMINSNKINLENLYKKEDNDNYNDNYNDNNNEIINEQNYIEGKSNKNSRNNDEDDDPYMNNYKKNSQNYENIPTNFGTNDNLNFDKTKTSYNMIEKNENLVENKALINTQENKNSIDNKNDKEEYEQNKTNIDNKKNKDISNYIQTAYQINIYKDEDKINVLNNKTNQYYMINILDKMKNIKNRNDIYILKMLIQRIKKNINQYAFQLIKFNYYVDKNKKNKVDNKNNNFENKKNLDYEYEKQNFFFNTIKRHLKINKIDNNLESNNEVVNLLKKCIPEYFDNGFLKNYIPYINKNLETNLINTELFLFDDDKLSDYIYKCYKIEKNMLTITPQIIKARLNKNLLKYQNLFSITRYMDNLYKDLINGNLCQKCYCKKNELCLKGCSCHNNNYMLNNNLNSIIKNYNVINIIDLSNEKKQNKKFEILKRFSESKEPSESDYRLSNNNERYSNNYNVNNTLQKNNVNNINIENLNKKNFEHERKDSCKINNLITNFSLRKKNRNSISSNTSNDNDEMGDKKNIKYNLNSNLKEKSINQINIINYDDDDQSNINDEEFNMGDNEGIKNINQSLFKKKINKIVPISNRNSNIISKVNAYRKRQNESRKKNKKVIKLRDDTNYDNEIYENV